MIFLRVRVWSNRVQMWFVPWETVPVSGVALGL